MKGFINSIEKSGLLTAVTVNSVLLGESGSQGYCRVKVLRVTPRKIKRALFEPCRAACSALELAFSLFLLPGLLMGWLRLSD